MTAKTKGIKVSEWGEGEVVPAAEAYTSLKLVVMALVKQQWPWSPWRAKMEQIFTCSPWRTPYWSRWMCPEASCSLRRATLDQNPAALWGSLEQSIPKGLHAVERNHCAAICEVQSIERRTHKINEGKSSLGGLHAATRKECEEEAASSGLSQFFMASTCPWMFCHQVFKGLT